MNLWLLFVLLGIGNFLLRYSFVYLFGKIELSARVRKALDFVPPTVLLALVLPAVVHSGPQAGDIHNPRLLAFAAASLIAFKTRSVFLTLLTGMSVLYLLTAWA